MNEEKEKTATIVLKAKKGDVHAFEELFKIYRQRVYNYSFRMVGDIENAKELTQDIFVKAFNGISHIRDEKLFGAWLMKIASNLIKDCLSKKKLKIEKNCIPCEFSTENTPEDEVGESDLKNLLLKELAVVSPLYREVLILHYMEGTAIQEISTITGLPCGTIKSRLSRGREELSIRIKHNITTGD